jgi:hypothetical protein
VEGPNTPSIPGVTEIDPGARLPSEGVLDAINPVGLLRAGHDQTDADEDAFEPPSDAVRREMRRMELEAQVMNAGEAVMDADDDDAELAPQPSQEALDALAAGELNIDPAALGSDVGAVMNWEDEEDSSKP